VTVDAAVTGAVRDAFGEMAFIDVGDGEPGPVPEVAQVLSLTFSDPRRGTLALLLPKACKKAIVENIYGVGWDSLTTDKIDDCLLELLNVLGGAFMRNYFGRETDFAISLPEMIFDESHLDVRGEGRDLFFDAEGVVFQVRIWVEGTEK
jgi:hypothetical protein